MTARWANTVGLVLGIVGVLILFRWGPPQPNFDEWVSLSVETPESEKAVEGVKQRKREYENMSSLGLGLIGLSACGGVARRCLRARVVI